MRIEYLSYTYTETLPIYGDFDGKVAISVDKSQENGDSCYTYRFAMGNHMGTHVDAPAHFIGDGKKIGEYLAEELVFNRVHLATVEAYPSQIITFSDIKFIDPVSTGTDILLIKTGFCEKRSDPVYSFENPGLSPDLAIDLIDHFPNLRAIAVDCCSISSFQHRDIGRLAHKSFLGRNILLMEDMDFRFLSTPPQKLVVAPIRLEKVDSAPCTVIGFWND